MDCENPLEDQESQRVGGKPVGNLQSVVLDLKTVVPSVKQIHVVRVGLEPRTSG